MRRVLRGVLVLGLALTLRVAVAGTCPTAIINPVTDVCWACTMPLSIGAVEVGTIGFQPDIDSNPGNPVCNCGLKVGLAIGFWEPTVLMETVREPYCFPGLGGVTLGMPIPAPRHARGTNFQTGLSETSFYHVHYYIYPLLAVLGVLLDDPCLDQRPWDLGYITEIDPTWNDPALGAIFNAESILFANPIAIASCASECVAATAGFPLPWLFWCAGCQGGIYPNQGWVQHHYGMVDASMLLTQRLLFKLHKQGTAWRHHGPDALCGPVIDLKLDKRGYRNQMLYPIPTPDRSDALGGSTLPWRAGKEFPIAGEDALYLLFRKRNCCQTASITVQ